MLLQNLLRKALEIIKYLNLLVIFVFWVIKIFIIVHLKKLSKYTNNSII